VINAFGKDEKNRKSKESEIVKKLGDDVVLIETI